MVDESIKGLYEVEPGRLGFRATLMEGSDISLEELAGFADDDPMVERAWENTNWRRILDLCWSAEVLDESDLHPESGEDDDDCPGMSDTWYIVRVPDPVRFAAELRAAFILAATDPKQLE